MPNQTLYDNFSQVRQYIDQEKPDLTSYVTKTELTNCGYVTSSDLPVINENIVPKENNTYTLGDSSYMYNATYSTKFYTEYLYLNENKVYIYSNSTGQMKFGVNGADRFRINYNTFEPSITGNTNLGGGISNPFTNAYFKNLYLNGTNIEDRFTYLVWTGTSAEYAALSNYTTYQLYLIENE